jgi:hypothetical protein
MKPSMILACLVIGVAPLGACSDSFDCSGGNYRGGCVPTGGGPVVAIPAPVSPPVSPAAPAPVGVTRGDPAQFADIDDRQCRSYGLTFGSRDYADCRIRLSAQHRGLDPNIR